MSQMQSNIFSDDSSKKLKETVDQFEVKRIEVWEMEETETSLKQHIYLQNKHKSRRMK